MMSTIAGISWRRVLNSHVEFTNEFIVELEDGSIGIGGSPKGETISIYEDKAISIEPQTIIQTIEGDGLLSMSLDQEVLDDYLAEHIALFGRNNAYGLSLASLARRAPPGPSLSF